MLTTINAVTDIYGIPKSTKGLYVHRVHGILKQLREWHDELPQGMRIRERGTPRPVASLHLAYNQCIIQTTRPVLLHLFKTQFHLVSKTLSDPPKKQTFSSITLALADSCVNAALASSRIVESLFLDGSIATFGFWDAHHIFSSALILIMSTIMKPSMATSEALETLLSILRSMKHDGNIPAVDFCERLSHIQTRVSTLRSQEQPILGNGDVPPDQGAVVNGNLINAQAEEAAAMALRTPSSMNSGDGDIHYGDVDILGNPLIGTFLDEVRVPCPEAPDAVFAEDGMLMDFACEIEEPFLF